MRQIIGPLLSRPDFTYVQLEADILRPVQQAQVVPAQKADSEWLRCLSALETASQQISTKIELLSECIRKLEIEHERLQQSITELQSQNVLMSENLVSAAVQERTVRLSELPVGATFLFGRTPNQEKRIVWRVLDQQTDRVLAIRKYGLSGRQYHSKKEPVTWESCDLRRWLNEEFYQKTFCDAEQKNILLSKVPAERNPLSNTDPGKDTHDKVFLLSSEEAARYFYPDKERKCKSVSGSYAFWWLRTPGDNARTTSCVYDNGFIYQRGSPIEFMLAVRPAMWLRADMQLAADSICKREEEQV